MQRKRAFQYERVATCAAQAIVADTNATVARLRAIHAINVNYHGFVMILFYSLGVVRIKGLSRDLARRQGLVGSVCPLSRVLFNIRVLRLRARASIFQQFMFRLRGASIQLRGVTIRAIALGRLLVVLLMRVRYRRQRYLNSFLQRLRVGVRVVYLITRARR